MKCFQVWYNGRLEGDYDYFSYARAKCLALLHKSNFDVYEPDIVLTSILGHYYDVYDLFGANILKYYE